MRLLGTEGIDVNAKDKKDCTPLLWACVKGLKRVALALVHGVISVNAMNVFGMTALEARHAQPTWRRDFDALRPYDLEARNVW